MEIELPEKYLTDIESLDKKELKAKMDKIREYFTSSDGSCIIAEYAIKLLASAEMGIHLHNYYDMSAESKSDEKIIALDLRDITLDLEGTYQNIKAIIQDLDDPVPFTKKDGKGTGHRTVLHLIDPTNTEVKRRFTFWGKLPNGAIEIPKTAIITNVKVGKWYSEKNDRNYIQLSSTRNTKFEEPE